jgi:predicted secreted Zn-dependent protease
MMRRACFAMAVVVLSMGSVVTAQSTDAFAGIPNITFTYYDVSGSTVAELRRSINKGRPADPKNGDRFDALSNWRVQWAWKSEGKTRCELGSATLSFSATVLMPRLAAPDSLSPELRVRWDHYIAALETHEAGHVRHAYDHHGEVLTAIKGATCETVTKAAQAAIGKIDQYNIEYDRQTRHGETQGAVFP